MYLSRVHFKIKGEILFLRYFNQSLEVPIQSITEINESDFYEGNAESVEIGFFNRMESYVFAILTPEKHYKISTRMADQMLKELKLQNPNIRIFVKPIR